MFIETGYAKPSNLSAKKLSLSWRAIRYIEKATLSRLYELFALSLHIACSSKGCILVINKRISRRKLVNVSAPCYSPTLRSLYRDVIVQVEGTADSPSSPKRYKRRSCWPRITGYRVAPSRATAPRRPDTHPRRCRASHRRRSMRGRDEERASLLIRAIFPMRPWIICGEIRCGKSVAVKAEATRSRSETLIDHVFFDSLADSLSVGQTYPHWIMWSFLKEYYVVICNSVFAWFINSYIRDLYSQQNSKRNEWKSFLTFRGLEIHYNAIIT